MLKTRCFRQLVACFFALVLFTPVAIANNQLTVADGDECSCNSPINFIWVDTQNVQTQVLYPADSLVDMINEPINSVRFYLMSGCGSEGGRLRVSVGETTALSFGQYVTGLTQVATISLTAGVNEILITFDAPYMYHGGNLVIEPCKHSLQRLVALLAVEGTALAVCQHSVGLVISRDYHKASVLSIVEDVKMIEASVDCLQTRFRTGTLGSGLS